MSANPTEYDLIQDARLDDVESSIKTSYEPPSAVEYSYPVVDQPMNDEMWQYVTLGFGDGVLDEGGQPYWLRNRENVNNTLQITTSTTTKTAQAILRGFYHKMIADKTFTVPPVSTTTTYHFCLTYNPMNSLTPQGPISLQMYAGTPPTTQGKFHIVLWTLERKPNQLLTDCAIYRVRQKITPTISVNSEIDLPDPATVLWGTRCLTTNTNQEFRAEGASDSTGGPTRWVEIAGGEWIETGTTPPYEWTGHGNKMARKKEGKTVSIRGRMQPVKGGSPFNKTKYGYWAFTLPEGWRPQREQRFIAAGAEFETPAIVTVNIGADGVVRIYPHGPTAWASVDGISFGVA